MKAKYLAAGIVIGTVLLTSNNINKPSKLEKSVQTTSISQPSDSNTPPLYPSEPSDPKDIDPNFYMKAILQPENRIYDSTYKALN